MPQADYNVGNIESQPFRLEMNACFEAAVTFNSGATEPTAKFPYMPWADTTNNLFKSRNAANNAWLTQGRLNQPFWGILPSDIGGLTAASNFSDIGNRETAKANLAISNGTCNRIINGCFRVNQRGNASYTWSATRTYTLDRWFYNMAAGGGTLAAGTVSRQTFTAGQTAVPGEPEAYVRLQNTTQGTSLGAASFHSFAQPIEDLRLLAGQTVTVSFWAQTTITNKTLGVDLTQNFGSGGSADVNVGGQTFTLSGTWQRFSFTVAIPSLSGKTLGSNHYTALNFFLQAGSSFSSRLGSTFGFQGTGDVNIANVQVEISPFVSTFERRSIADEISLCQRFYEETNIVVGANSAGATGFFTSIYFKNTKRIIPNCAVKSYVSQSNFTIDSFSPTLSMTSANCTITGAGAYAANAVLTINAEF